jgi:hypothetical protein
MIFHGTHHVSCHVVILYDKNIRHNLDGEAVVLARRVHQLLEMVAAVLLRWSGWPIHGGNFFFIVPGMMVPPAPIGVFPILPLLAAWFIGIARTLSLAENCPYCVFPVSELDCYLEVVGSCFRLPSP